MGGGLALPVVNPNAFDVFGDRGITDRRVELERGATPSGRCGRSTARWLLVLGGFLNQIGADGRGGQARHVDPARFLEAWFAADMSIGLEEVMLAEHCRASRGYGAPVDGFGQHGREESTGILCGGQCRAGLIAVDEAADLVNDIAALIGYGQWPYVKADPQPDGRGTGEPHLLTTGQRCVEPTQQRVDEPGQGGRREQENGTVARVLTGSRRVLRVFEPALGERRRHYVLDIATRGAHLRLRDLTVFLHVEHQQSYLGGDAGDVGRNGRRSHGAPAFQHKGQVDGTMLIRRGDGRCPPVGTLSVPLVTTDCVRVTGWPECCGRGARRRRQCTPSPLLATA